MKHFLKRMIVAAGLEKPARRLLKPFVERGWTRWKPLVPEEEFSACFRNAIRTIRSLEPSTKAIGNYVEFGVSRGTSLACAHHTLRDEGLSHIRLIGFDSFEGLPSEAAHEGWVPGAFCSTLSATKDYLRSRRVDMRRVELVKGWFKDTLTEQTRQSLRIGKASFIMVDCDIYSASVDALTFVEPHIVDHAVVIFDDWGDDALPLECQQKAFSEFLADHSDITATALPAYGRARIFCLERDSLQLGQQWAAIRGAT